MSGERGSRDPGFLAPDFLALHGIDVDCGLLQNSDLFGAERIGKEQITVAVELSELLLIELHGCFRLVRQNVWFRLSCLNSNTEV